MKKSLLFVLFLSIPSFHLYSQIYFSEQIIINHADIDGPESVYTADLDGDGDMDVLSASSDDDKIAWYENIDGKGTFGPQRVITQSADSPRSVYAADLDGDGDIDVLSASILDDKIAWYENTDGKGAFGSQRVISLAANGAISVFASDLDGDGDMDVLSALYSDNAVAWYENTDGKGTFGPQQVFTTQAGLASCVYGADLDGDGDVDVLSASTIDDKIAWYENTDGKGTFGPQRVISAVADMASSVYAVDVDGDGDLDVLSASIQDDKIAWYENIDGKGAFSPQKVITREADAPWSVFAADLDGDGDVDVLSASAGDDKIACYENIDGQGTFGPQQEITTKADGARSVYASDLDGDGRMDVLSVSWKGDEIAWHRNREATLWDGFVEHLIDADKGANSIDCGDLDGDGDADVIGATNEIVFYENLDFGSGSFLKHSIGGGATAVCMADMDGDNALDVLSGAYKEIAWWKYAGADTFTKHIVDDQNYQSRSIDAIDLDGDGDMDVLAASSAKGEIAWWENDGSENFAKKIISGNLYTIKSIYAIDMDRDGDADMLSVESSTISWWENDGLQNFSKHIVASKLNFAVYAVAIDLDKDDDVDVIGVDEYGNQIILWENDGLQSFAKVVIDAEISWPTWVYVSDLDNDEDLDLLAVSNIDDYVCLYENLGLKSFYKQIIRKNFDGASCVHAADLDNDGDMDIIGGTASAAHEIIWWENPLLVNPNLKTPDIVVFPDTLFFYIGTDEQKNTIVCSVKNIGSGILQVQNISSETNWIANIDTINFFVKQGGEQQVTVKCSAEGLFNGVYEGVLVIRSNDPDRPIFNLPLVLEMRNGLDVNFVNELEPNNNPSQAQKLFAPSPSGIKGTITVSDVGEKIIQDDDIEDLYVFKIGSNGIKLKLYDISADLDLILMKIVGNTTTIWGSNHRGSSVDEEFEKADLEPGTYYVGVAIYDSHPIQDSSSYSLVLEGDIITEVKKYDSAIPQNFTLSQNYPNPFNHFTTINFQVPKSARITIKIYDTLGKEVRTLVNAFYNAGNHNATWDGSDNFGDQVTSGVYFYYMKSIDFKEVKKALLLK
ncbi:MAG TPA: FG-GAP-like repeat-containing protein [bacterium]